jgi:hypothetical protein
VTIAFTVSVVDHREPLFSLQGRACGHWSATIDYAYKLQTDGREVAGGGQGRTDVLSLRWDTPELAKKIQR